MRCWRRCGTTKKTSRLKKPPPTTTPKFDRIQAAAAGIELATELASIAERFVKRTGNALTGIRRAPIRPLGGRREATALALEDLNRLNDNARQRIVDSTADQADLRESLHDMVGQLRELISRAKSCCGAELRRQRCGDVTKARKLQCSCRFHQSSVCSN